MNFGLWMKYLAPEAWQVARSLDECLSDINTTSSEGNRWLRIDAVVMPSSLASPTSIKTRSGRRTVTASIASCPSLTRDPILDLQKLPDNCPETGGIVCDQGTNSCRASNGCWLFVACEVKSGVQPLPPESNAAIKDQHTLEAGKECEKSV